MSRHNAESRFLSSPHTINRWCEFLGSSEHLVQPNPSTGMRQDRKRKGSRLDGLNRALAR